MIFKQSLIDRPAGEQRYMPVTTLNSKFLDIGYTSIYVQHFMHEDMWVQYNIILPTYDNGPSDTGVALLWKANRHTTTKAVKIELGL